MSASVLALSAVLGTGCGDDSLPPVMTDGDGGPRDGMIVRPDGSLPGDGEVPPDGSMPPIDSGPAVCGDGRRSTGEECDDGNTSDGDGCSSTCTAEGSCDDPIDLATFGMTHPDGSITLRGTNVAGSLGDTGSCAGDGPHVVFTYTPAANGLLSFSTHGGATTFDTVLYVRTACDDPSTELACNDDSLDTLDSFVMVPASAGTTYFVFVDSFDTGGTFELTVRLSPTRGPGEVCDPTGMADRCAPGLLCADDGAGRTTCQALDLGCGVGVAPVDLTARLSMGSVVHSGSTVGEEAYHQGMCATAGGTAPEVVHTLTLPYRADVAAGLDAAWDAVLYARLSCSDPATERFCGLFADYENLYNVDAGNTIYFYVDGAVSEFGTYDLYVDLRRVAGAGEDCSGITMDVRCDDGLACRTEGAMQVCRATVCGDGVIEGSETCDDLNAIDGDGCSSTCAFEDPGPGGEDCFGAVPLTLVPTLGGLGASATGDTTGAGADLTPSCSSLSTAPDLVYSVTLTMPGTIIADVEPDPGFDAAIHIQGAMGLACGDPMSELGCTDFGVAGDSESAFVFGAAPGTYYIVVDGGMDPLASQGMYRVNVYVM